MTDAQRQMAKLEYQGQSAEAMQRLGYQIGFAEHALKALLIVNGGAIIGLFTFIGNAGAARLTFDVTDLWKAFISFAAGLALTITAQLGAFLSQGQFYSAAQSEAWRYLSISEGGDGGGNDSSAAMRWGAIWQCCGVVAGVLALVAFIVGAAFALAGVLPA